MVFYRKYRPQTIADLDSATVRETLTAVLSKGNTHAFLFTGPKGLGKTSTARIVAKAINCIGRQSSIPSRKAKNTEDQRLITKNQVEPCNTCEQCISITNGSNLDVFEIDAASNRGIDEIRDLKEKINLAPLRAKKKVYIIDEVHMLTTEAFNALLKTLEEPPEHAMFILCTTEDHKIPPTILSRCFHICFSPATKEELIRSFTRIAQGEDLQIDQETLGLIADLAEGGFRDGAKIMEELSLLSGDNTITKELIESKYHISSSKQYGWELIASLETHDIKRALSIVSALHLNNISPMLFLQELLEILHILLLSKYAIDTRLKEKETKLSVIELKYLLQLFSQAMQDMKYAVIPTLPLELAIIEWGGGNELGIDKKEETHESAEIKSQGKHVELNSDVTVTALRKQLGNISKIKALYGEEKPVAKVKNDNIDTVSILDFTADGEITKEWLNAFWKALIAEMKSYNHTLAGVLRGCTLKSFDRKSLIIETAYKFHKEKLDEGRTMQTLETVCKSLTGKQVTITVVLKN